MTGYDLELQGGYQCSVDVLPTTISHKKQKNNWDARRLCRVQI